MSVNTDGNAIIQLQYQPGSGDWLYGPGAFGGVQQQTTLPQSATWQQGAWWTNQQDLVNQLMGNGGTVAYDGSKVMVVCAGQITECKTIEEAQSRAEELAHQHSATAWILKPVRKVKPKRDVVTEELT